MGPGFDVRSPPELTIKFLTDAQDAETSIALTPTNGPPSRAEHVALHEEPMTIEDGDVRLSGTLLIPATAGPHPAIILLHGSGPLTRYSFGPYPHFFTSLGFAVLIYDKRGTGASTETRVDASTVAISPLPQEYYPDSLTADAMAALRFLQGRDDINRRRIGFWGSSEGGMLTTQVAARSKEVAFIIDSSGFMGPLWQTARYQSRSIPQSRGLSRSEVEESVAFSDLKLRVARTGKDWGEFVRQREDARKEGKAWFVQGPTPFSSVDQMRWAWEHILTFSPLPNLKKVTCPILAVYGEKDLLTETPVAVRNMRGALADSGNPDVTIKVFPNAGHSLAEVPSGSRMAPGVFDTLRSWLLQRVKWTTTGTASLPDTPSAIDLRFRNSPSR